MISVWTTFTRSRLLHDAWRLDTYLGLICAMVSAAVLSFLYEYFDIFKLKVVKLFLPHKKSLTCTAHEATTQEGSSLPARLVSTAFYTCRVVLVYVLMLFVMTMNVWILVTVLLGTGAGYISKKSTKTKNLRSDIEIRNLKPTNETIAKIQHCEPLVVNEKEPAKNEPPLEITELLDKNEDKSF
ncbi:uncharacterized protein LOC111104198 isoform X2 [Crassostrea virginica]